MIEQKPNIAIDDLMKIDLRVGTIEKAELHPSGTKLLILTVDFGQLGKRTICAGIREFFVGNDSEIDLAKLNGVQAVFVVNLPPRLLRGVQSEGMILAASNIDSTRLGIVQVQGASSRGDPSDVIRFLGGEQVG